jgi:hypothetical protein
LKIEPNPSPKNRANALTKRLLHLWNRLDRKRMTAQKWSEFQWHIIETNSLVEQQYEPYMSQKMLYAYSE